MNKVKKTLMYFIALKKLFLKDKNRKFPLGIKRIWYSIRRGFLPESYIIYDFINNTPKDYLSDISRTYKTPAINGTNSFIFDSKLFFASLFNDKNASIPIFYINKNKIIKIETGELISTEEFIDFLKTKFEYVFKPDGGGGGHGIKFLKYSKSNWYVNNEKQSIDEILSIVKSLTNTLVYKKIDQNGFANEVFPNSVNTIRILTMIEPNTNEPFIASAVFRCGTDKSNGVDNWSSGGLSSNIDIKSGKLSKAVSYPYDGKIKWLKNHPNSGFKIEGFSISNWEKIKNEILAIARKYFLIPYVGWDIIPMDGYFIILEANSNSDVNLLQVHEPLLKNPKVRLFYEYYDVI